MKSPLETLTEGCDLKREKPTLDSSLEATFASSVKRIYADFIADDALHQVALPKEMINKIEVAISDQNSSPDIFEPSFHYICNILKYNFYNEFLQIAERDPMIDAHEDNIPCVSLQQILNEETICPYSFSDFLDFAKAEFGEENVLFLKDIQNYRKQFLRYFPDVSVDLNAKLDRLGIVRPVSTANSSSRSSSNVSLLSKNSNDMQNDSLGSSLLHVNDDSKSSLNHQVSNNCVDKNNRSSNPTLSIQKPRKSLDGTRPSSPLSSPLALSPTKKAQLVTKSSSLGNIKSTTSSSPCSPSPSKKSGLIMKAALSRASSISNSSMKRSYSSLSSSMIIQPKVEDISAPERPANMSKEDFEKKISSMKSEYRNILLKFVDEESPKQVNLSVKQVNDLKEHFSKERLNPIVFTYSYDHIYDMLRLNLLQKFLKTTFFASPNSRPFADLNKPSMKELLLDELKSPLSLKEFVDFSADANQTDAIKFLTKVLSYYKMAAKIADIEFIQKDYESSEELQSRMIGVEQPVLMLKCWKPNKRDSMFIDEFSALNAELLKEARFICERFLNGCATSRLQLPDDHVKVLEAEIERGNLHPDIFLPSFEYVAIGLKRNTLDRFVKSKSSMNKLIGREHFLYASNRSSEDWATNSALSTPGRCAFLMMPVEVNLIVLHHLDTSSLARLMRTSKEMYYLCRSFLYKHPSISSSFQLALFLQFTQNRDLLLTLDIGAVDCSKDSFPCFHWNDLNLSLDHFKFKLPHFSWPQSAFIDPVILDSNPKAVTFKRFVLLMFERFYDYRPLRPNLMAIDHSEFSLFQTIVYQFLPILPSVKSRLGFAAYVFNSISVGSASVPPPLNGLVSMKQTKFHAVDAQKKAYHVNANDATRRQKFQILTSTIKNIADSCPNIRAFVFNNQDLLQDSYVELMRDYESNLIHVNLVDMVKTPVTISDALSVLVKSCKQLQFLDVSWSSWLTVSHLAIILESHSIRILNLIGCCSLPIQISRLYHYESASKLKSALFRILWPLIQKPE